MLLLLLATSVTFAGCWALASRLEPTSAGRRVLAFLVAVPAQVTVVMVAPGVVGVLRPGVVATLAGLVGLAELRWLAPPRRSTARPLRVALGAAVRSARHRPGLLGLTTLVGVAAAWQVALAARLPVRAWDSLWYHLLGPSTWVQHGRIEASGLNPFSDGYPQGQEVLHGWTILFLHSTRGTAVIGAWSLAMACVAIFLIARRFASFGAGVLAAATFASMPAASLQIAAAYVDLAAAATLLATVALLLDWERRATGTLPFRGRAATSLVLAGAAAGLAIGVKAANVAVVGAGAAFLIAVTWRESAREGPPFISVRRERLVLAGTAVLLFLGGGWYVRNWISHGNPVWPVSALGFPGLGTMRQMVAGGQAPKNLADLPLPLQLGRSWVEDLRHPTYIYDQRLGGFGPIWILACVPALVWFTLRSWRRDRLAWVFALGTAAAAALLSQMAWWARFSLALAAVGCIALGAAVDALTTVAPGRWQGIARHALHLAVAAAVLVAVQSTVWRPQERIAYPTARWATVTDLGRAIRRGDGAEHLAPWAYYRSLDALPPGSRIAVTSVEAVGLPQLLMGEDLRRQLVLLPPAVDEAGLRRNLRRAGARYLFVPNSAPATSLERTAAADPTKFRVAPLSRPLPDGVLYELGGFRYCGQAKIGALAGRTGKEVVIAGLVADRCGRVGGTELELWQSGPVADSPHVGSLMVGRTRPSDRAGRWELAIPARKLDDRRTYWVVQPGHSSGGTYHGAGASSPFAPPT